ncbi:MAG: hypothetical protein ABW219_00675 [Ilumatobacteraceae bacterium]
MGVRTARVIIGAVVLLGACSSNREARPSDARPAPTAGSTEASAAETTDVSASSAAGSAPSTDGSVGSTSSTSASSTSSTVPASTAAPATTTVTGTAVAGTAGPVEASGPPFPQTEPFAEAVRLADGTCVGWAGSQGGSTLGLAVGAPVTVLDAVDNVEIGTGTVQASRWEDMSAGGEQWNCFFDFTATLNGAVPAEFRIRVGPLGPWTARPDPAAPTTYVASVSTNASVALIPSCPAIVEPDPTASTVAAPVPATVAPTSAPPLVTGWNAVGQYWSRGVASLCGAGLPVTAIARPCRPAGVGSEYIISVVDSNDPTEIYANGAEIPLGTELTVVVATGRLCA